MSRSFEVHQEFDRPAAQVRAMMVDPAYIRLRAERTGAIGVEIEVSTGPDTGADLRGRRAWDHHASSAPGASIPVHLRITRILPTEDAPAFARSLLGDRLTVSETQVWSPVIDGIADATMEASFGSLVRLTATIRLADRAGASVAVTKVDCKASVPLVGGKVEELVEKQVREYLGYEVKVAAEWLADPGN